MASSECTYSVSIGIYRTQFSSSPELSLGSISPESAGLYMSASLASASGDVQRYLSEISPSPRSQIDGISSPVLPSPIISSMDASLTVRKQRREVHFEDSIISETLPEDRSSSPYSFLPDRPSKREVPWTKRSPGRWSFH